MPLLGWGGGDSTREAPGLPNSAFDSARPVSPRPPGVLLRVGGRQTAMILLEQNFNWALIESLRLDEKMQIKKLNIL